MPFENRLQFDFATMQNVIRPLCVGSEGTLRTKNKKPTLSANPASRVGGRFADEPA